MPFNDNFDFNPIIKEIMEMAGHNSQIYRTSKRGNSPVLVLQIPINLITEHKLSGRNVNGNWNFIFLEEGEGEGEKKENIREQSIRSNGRNKSAPTDKSYSKIAIFRLSFFLIDWTLSCYFIRVLIRAMVNYSRSSFDR